MTISRPVVTSILICLAFALMLAGMGVPTFQRYELQTAGNRIYRLDAWTGRVDLVSLQREGVTVSAVMSRVTPRDATD